MGKFTFLSTVYTIIHFGVLRLAFCDVAHFDRYRSLSKLISKILK